MIILCSQTHIIDCHVNLSSFLEWIKDENKKGSVLQKALVEKRRAQKEYIEVLLHFGPALKGKKEWRAGIKVMHIDKYLTVSDEAFLAVCIINYGERWMALVNLEDEEVGKEANALPVRNLIWC